MCETAEPLKDGDANVANSLAEVARKPTKR